MKHLLLFIVISMVCVNAAAQEENAVSQSVKIDTVALGEMSRDSAFLKKCLLGNKQKP